jgi:8-oxo-dGTP diphosphatase
VHREKYRDWGFPKGKQDPGEELPTTAVREVMEEAGIKIKLGRKLSTIHYQVGSGEDKEVHYWAAKVKPKAIAKQAFSPNEEIAKVEWIEAGMALDLLSYEHDKEILQQAIDLHRINELETRALIVLRHATATPRLDWDGEEAKRPLLPFGKLEAKQLVPLIAAFGPKKLITSPWTRCLDTVAPYAKKSGKTIIKRVQLTERANAKKPNRTLEVVFDLVGSAKTGLICSHRPALPSVLNPLSKMAATKELGNEIESASNLKPGEFAVVRLTLSKKPRVVSIERWMTQVI